MLANERGGCPLTSNPHLRGMIVLLKVVLIVFALLYLLPLGIAALLYRVEGSGIGLADGGPVQHRHPAAAGAASRRLGPYLFRQDRSLAWHLRVP